MEDTQITLSLTLAQVNVVLAALGKQPLEVVWSTFAVIREQAEKQVRDGPPRAIRSVT